MRELNYTPSILAQGMRKQRTKTFGVLIPDFKNLFYAEFLEHVESAARKHGYVGIVCSTDIDSERERDYINQLLRRQIDGLIMCWYKGVGENRAFLVQLAKRLPVVIMDQPSCGLPISAVYTDAFGGIKNLTEYFLGLGHRRIALIRALDSYPVGRKRFEGYAAALREYGIEVDESFVEQSEWTSFAASDATNRLLKRFRPTAIVAVTDLMAIGVLSCLHDKGYEVPGDISVGGFDNIAIASQTSPPLTTVAQPIDQMAFEATQQLIRRIENRRIKNRDVVLPNKLIIRESSGPPPMGEILSPSTSTITEEA
jgi:DNA-binding LacI/PurR family transcriptional regulator